MIYSDDDLLKILKDEFDKNPNLSYREFNKNLNTPSSTTYQKRFGSWNNAKKMIGLNCEYKKHYTDEEELLKILKEAFDENPNILMKDFNSSNGLPHISAYNRKFGSFRNAKIKAGVKSNLEWGMYTEEELVANLYRLKDELKFIPTSSQIRDCRYLPDLKVLLYKLNYQSLEELQLYIFGEISDHTNIKYTENGTKYLSTYEYVIALILEGDNYNFIKDDKYKNYIKNLKSNHTVDFVLLKNNKHYFIEVFGMVGIPEYIEKTAWKIQLCKDNNIPLLALYPKDISMSQFDELSDTIRRFVEN